MAGRGPQPKEPGRRARTNGGGQMTVLRFEASDAPSLPDRFDWPERTREWWAMWCASPQSETFVSTDWDFLLDTALIHADFWSGNTAVAGELRLRVAKFGATPEDRARLRITFAAADDAEDKPRQSASARDRYKGLKAVDRDVAGA